MNQTTNSKNRVLTPGPQPPAPSPQPPAISPKTLRDIGELGAIERLTRALPGRQDVVVGAGDDCAVVRTGNSAADDLVLTSDPVIAEIHFTAEADLESVGHKALGRVLSDIAAMGAEPRWVLVDVVAPADTPVNVIDAIYLGMGKLAEQFSVAIVGGDMAEGLALEIHVFGVGAVPVGAALLRSTASAGELLFVTGKLGGSRLGRHLQFAPRIKEGLFLRDWASSMIDVSDGLSSDLQHILDMSRVGCDLNLDQIPLSDAANNMNDKRSAVEHALYDGEDFELLFTISALNKSEFVEAWKNEFDIQCTEIGIITSDKYRLQTNQGTKWLEQTGYRHFS